MVKKKSGILINLKKTSDVLWRRLFSRPEFSQSDCTLADSTTANVTPQRNGDAVATITSTERPPESGILKKRRSPSTPKLPEIRPTRSWYSKGKVILDYTLAVLISLIAVPVTLLAMLLVKLTSRGPALYSQTRVGLNGKPFTIWKIRSMRHKCESLTGACWSKPGDPRITLIGKVLRASHIDELPQLWNVLRGEMSLVGPRPERPEFVPQLEKAIPLYSGRLSVRPGVTGIAQIQLPPDTSLDSVRAKLSYDLHYVRHMNLFLDLRIILGTMCKLFCFPFSAIRWLLGFRGCEAIRNEYHQLCKPQSK